MLPSDSTTWSSTTGHYFVFFGFQTEAVREKEKGHAAMIERALNYKDGQTFEGAEDFDIRKEKTRFWLDVTAGLACIPGANIVAAIAMLVFGFTALFHGESHLAPGFFGMAAANLIYPVGCFMHLGGALYQNWGTIANFFGFSDSASSEAGDV